MKEFLLLLGTDIINIKELAVPDVEASVQDDRMGVYRAFPALRQFELTDYLKPLRIRPNKPDFAKIADNVQHAVGKGQ